MGPALQRSSQIPAPVGKAIDPCAGEGSPSDILRRASRMTIGEVLKEELEGLSSSFMTGELAYLALTSKVEFPIRDRLAFRLHTRLGAGPSRVAREWHRTDLAVLKADGAPILLLEVKAMYSFDAVDSAVGLNNFHRQVLKDHGKSLRPEARGAEIYALLLVTHPKGHCDKGLGALVKYRTGIERAAKRGIERVREDAAAAISKAFDDFRLVTTKGTLEAGSAFGVAVGIDYHLFGPLPAGKPEVSPDSTKVWTTRSA